MMPAQTAQPRGLLGQGPIELNDFLGGINSGTQGRLGFFSGGADVAKALFQQTASQFVASFVSGATGQNTSVTLQQFGIGQGNGVGASGGHAPGFSGGLAK